MTYSQRALARTHEKDVEIGQGEPGEDQVQGVVARLEHEADLARHAVVGPQDLADVDEGVYGSE